MEALTFLLPKIEISYFTSVTSNQWQLAIAGGRAPSKEWLKLVSKEKKVFCADKGIEAALEAEIIPKLLLGDGDSASKASYERAAILGTEIRSFPREKDDTDLQLLLKSLSKENLCITGIWGGRFDHLYSNVFSLLNWFQNSSCKVIMADEKEVMLFLGAGDEVELQLKVGFKPKAISLLTLTAEVKVDFEGVHWPLKKAKLEYLKPYTISNEVDVDKVRCNCYSGYVGLYMYLKE